jgi:hypothetical protein
MFTVGDALESEIFLKLDDVTDALVFDGSECLR